MAADVSPEANRYRIQRLEQDMQNLQSKLDTYGVLQQKVATLMHDVEKLDEDFASVRRMLIAATLTVGGGALLTTISVLVAMAQG